MNALSRILCTTTALCALFSSACSRSSHDSTAEAEGTAATSPAPVLPVLAATASVDGPRRSLEDIPFEYSWDLQLPSPVHMSWMHPDLPKLLFFQLNNGQIFAIDALSGETQWVTRRLGRRMEHVPTARRLRIAGERSGEFVFDDRLYAVSGETLFCFDAVYGQLIWSHDLGTSGGGVGFIPSTRPVFQGSLSSQRIFLGDWSGRIQVITYDEEKNVAFWQWQNNLQAVPTATPVAAEDGLTYVADMEGFLHCFGRDRVPRWSFNTVSRLSAPPLIRGRTAYLGSRSNVLHVLNRLSGEEIARLVLDEPVVDQPMAFRRESDRIYVWTGSRGRSTLRAIRTLADEVPYEDFEQFPLEIERVEEMWSRGGLDQLVSSSPRHLFITRSGRSDRVLAINRESGAIDWHWDINPDRAGGTGRMGRGGPVSHIVNYQDPDDAQRSIFTVDERGYVVAYRLFGQFR